MTNEDNPRYSTRLSWWLVAAVLLAVGTVALGFVLPAHPTQLWSRLGLIPGVLLAALVLAIGARPDLNAIKAQRQNTEPEEDEELPAPDKGSEPITSPTAQKPHQAAKLAPENRPPAPAPPVPNTGFVGGSVVRLGPLARPAFARWQLRWESGHGKQGTLPLQMGDSVTLGRHEQAHIIVDLPEVSRRHLVFRVQSNNIEVTDKSSKGTWICPYGGHWEPMQKGKWEILTHGARLRLADPPAIALTLEPIEDPMRR